MSAQIRRILSSGLAQAVKHNLDDNKLQNNFTRVLKLTGVNKQNDPEIRLSLKDLRSILNANLPQPPAVDEIVPKILEHNYDTNVISSIHYLSTNRLLVFTLNKENLIRDTLSNTDPSPVHLQLIDEPQENIIVEFSSPNIAKPFHFGHLRSTIIGNFISNILQFYGHNVIRMNYLGDWGTQFGFLKLGMELANLPDEEVAKNPIKHLFNAYVNANRLAEDDKSFATTARNIFAEMENGNHDNLTDWVKYREYTVNELTTVYKRLNIKFDEYCWESQYARKKIGHVLEAMQTKGLLVNDVDGTVSVNLANGERATVLKSDDTTLYLTRDIGAIVDRQQRYNFDKMYYVVENGQHNHFSALFEIAQKMGVRNATGLHHVKFGRIAKMSTRKGNVVFLTDLLDEAQEIMLEKQRNSKNTKIDLDADSGRTADILGVTAIVLSDLQRHRLSNYEFDLSKILEDIGMKSKNFQYTHCRLCSLEQNTGVMPATQCDPKYLLEPEAIALIVTLAQLPEVLYKAKQDLGAQVLVSYMYSLTADIGKCFKSLKIKGESDINLQQQRMLLFTTVRKALGECMKILGLVPLNQM